MASQERRIIPNIHEIVKNCLGTVRETQEVVENFGHAIYGDSKKAIPGDTDNNSEPLQSADPGAFNALENDVKRLHEKLEVLQTTVKEYRHLILG